MHQELWSLLLVLVEVFAEFVVAVAVVVVVAAVVVVVVAAAADVVTLEHYHCEGPYLMVHVVEEHFVGINLMV